MLYYNKARDFVTGMVNATTVPKQPERGAGFTSRLNILLAYLPSSPSIRLRSDEPETTALVSEEIRRGEATH